LLDGVAPRWRSVSAERGEGAGDWPEPPENIREHVISLKMETPLVEAVREHAAAALARIKPDELAGARISATAEMGYLVWGNLFKTGGCCALYEPREKGEENTASLGLAEWKDGKWELRGLWKMPLHWMPEADRWIGTSGYCNPQDTVRAPFELVDLISDEVPEVIVFGEKTKYHQAIYVMKFDKESRGLDLLTYSMAKPMKVGNYLRTYDASRNKPIWQEWTFLEWTDGKLEERATWHSEVPYNNEDPEFRLVEVTGKKGQVEKFRIVWEGSEMDRQSVVKVTRGQAPCATMKISWREAGDETPKSYLPEEPWLFEKLTGLPHDCFPELSEKRMPRLSKNPRRWR
jgi:hypothetical protein